MAYNRTFSMLFLFIIFVIFSSIKLNICMCFFEIFGNNLTIKTVNSIGPL